jgi:hypothetical protein
MRSTRLFAAILALSSFSLLHNGCGDDSGIDGAGGGNPDGSGGGAPDGGGGGGAPDGADGGLETDGGDRGQPDGGAVADCTDVGAGEMRVYAVSSLVLNASNDPVVAGLDLDGEDSACGMLDFPESVDNGFAYLRPILDTVASAAGGGSVNALLKDLDLTITLHGYDGSGNDPCVLVDLDTIPGGAAEVMGAAGSVTNRVLVVPSLGTFPLEVPAVNADLDFDVTGGALRFDLLGRKGALGGVVARGGLDYSYDTTAAADPGSLHRGIHDVLTDLEDFIPGTPQNYDALIESSLDDATDIDPESGVACSGISIGFALEADLVL